jgi:hypothetical protein
MGENKTHADIIVFTQNNKKLLILGSHFVGYSVYRGYSTENNLIIITTLTPLMPYLQPDTSCTQR